MSVELWDDSMVASSAVQWGVHMVVYWVAWKVFQRELLKVAY